MVESGLIVAFLSFLLAIGPFKETVFNVMIQSALISGCCIILCANFAQADEPPLVEAEVLGSISDGTPSPSALPLAMPDFRVKSTVIREIDVVEAPPMPGLPLVEGTITATVHVVEDPKLPDPPPPPVSVDDSGGNSLTEDSGENDEWGQMAFLSATVYDHSRTLLRCHPNGNLGNEITVWSNLDFNHFSGFSNFEVKAADGSVRRYDLLMMGIDNEDTQKNAALLASDDVEYNLPEIPLLPDGQPAYVIVGAAPDAAPNADAVQFVEDLHALYRSEGVRMEAAYHARIEAEAEQRAYYLANPPVPKDVTMNFWERDHPVGMSADSIKKGGGN